MRRYFVIRFFAFALAVFAPVYLIQASNKLLIVDDDALYSSQLPDSITIDSIAVHKANREMLVFSKNRLVKIYRIHLGRNAVGPKQVSGDYKTPEGLYYITHRNSQSLFHKSLGVSYPNEKDLARAKRIGKSAGGGIVIHGLPNRDAHVGHDRYQNDWTWGCIGLRNEEIDELFMRVKLRAPIMITP
jgi:murein L,D-transpeptidase YafK